MRSLVPSLRSRSRCWVQLTAADLVRRAFVQAEMARLQRAEPQLRHADAFARADALATQRLGAKPAKGRGKPGPPRQTSAAGDAAGASVAAVSAGAPAKTAAAVASESKATAT